ncbi:MerR family transcriptional regulator [Deinococcus detaillensis]|uniref:MerR family transcriptional regulator n=1 Tax=Deinococcus detaillensis TaxID=2592048 RepID=A0A553V0Y0_9DEIO|nr:MerR family transcriptional regulator [Deinococcus detaillensis]TSA86130.1 MerR family transcriptional regulator [Deinococcus detaillensis]
MTYLADSSGLFTASEVEAQLGVPATTLRQWERRYGLPNPERNASGYRLYSKRDVALIDFIRQRIEEGVPASRAAELARGQFGLLTDAPQQTPSYSPAAQSTRPATGQTDTEPTRTGTAGSELADADPVSVQNLTAALLRADLSRAEGLLAQAQAQLGTEGLLMKLIQPALLDIGERWERGEITVAHEHQASAFLRTHITNLLNAAGHSRFGPSVVAACGPREQHELGLLMLCVMLRRMGVQVHYLGANTPLADLGVYARSVGARAILLSINTHEALQEALEQRHDLNSGQKGQASEIPVFVGGHVINVHPSAAAELGRWAGSDGLQAAQMIVATLESR